MNKYKNTLLELYAAMYRIRYVEEEIAKRYPEGKMRCPTHLSTGQEAVPAALSLIFRNEDFAVSTHRAHAHYLAKGGDLKKMLAEIYGKKTGCSKGRGGSMHLIDLSKNFMGSSAIVANSIPIGVGLALSALIKKEKRVSYVFFGDGAVEEGVFYESLNFSIVKKLPVIFICENNFYSVYSSLKERQPINRKIYKMAKAIGVKSFFYKTDDVYKLFKFLKKKINIKKNISGPLFFEFETYRWREHCGPNFDNSIGYRKESEFKKWKKKDPLLKLQKKLISLNFSLEAIQKKTKLEVLKAFEFAEKSKFPNNKKDLIETNVYAK